MSEQRVSLGEDAIRSISQRINDFTCCACADVANEYVREFKSDGEVFMNDDVTSFLKQAKEKGTGDMEGALADYLYNDAEFMSGILGDYIYGINCEQHGQYADTESYKQLVRDLLEQESSQCMRNAYEKMLG